MKVRYPNTNFSLTDIKGEYWQDLPMLDGVYLISNYGRIKAARRWVQMTGMDRGYWLKERIRKTQIGTQIVSGGKRKLYRLAITLKFEGRHYSIGIARFVYFLFVRKFDLEDRTRVVVCKDGNPFNIRPDNLHLITSSASATKAYRLAHRPRDSFRNKANPVSQYDLQGQYIATFPSINAAALACRIHTSRISTAMRSSNGYAGNYLWKSGKPEKEIIRVPRYAKEKLASAQLHASVISQYDLGGKKLKEFPNLKKAARTLRIQPSLIRRVLVGKSLTAKGYYWKLGKGPARIVLDHLQKSRSNWEKKICRPITQYSLNGDWIGTYPSQAEAARQLKISTYAISSALRAENLTTAGGYFWQYGEGPARIKVPERLKHRYALRLFYQQPVTRYDRQGKRIATYDTVTAAAEAINVQRHNLVAALTGKLLTCGNCYWRLGKGKASINVDEMENMLRRRMEKFSCPVIQCSPSGKKLMSYPSMAAARRATGAAESNIRRVINGKSKMTKGFVWKLAKNNL
ncbi:MAG TPA: NUMOD1 domain-containing DNA-binding protein [Puia sp.]|nr:NUMOD1 domain-containing DNA-binding protein [Puia sp.]